MSIIQFNIHKTAIQTTSGNRYVFATKSYDNSSAIDAEVHIVDKDFKDLGRGSCYTVYNQHFKIMHENLRKKITDAGGKIHLEHSTSLDTPNMVQLNQL